MSIISVEYYEYKCLNSKRERLDKNHQTKFPGTREYIWVRNIIMMDITSQKINSVSRALRRSSCIALCRFKETQSHYSPISVGQLIAGDLSRGAKVLGIAAPCCRCGKLRFGEIHVFHPFLIH